MPHDRLDDDLVATDPDCPICGTRCTPTDHGWLCRNCDLPLIG